jgi:multidrug resistance efflux pump
VMAPVTAVHVRPGDRVRRGAALITLDARDIQANSSRAAAAATSAAESVRASEADLRAAESAVVLARATNERIQGLFAKRSSTAQEVDQSVAALSSAEAQVEAARARLSAATAARDAARAGADSARINATYSVLVAPFDGVVTERRVDPGSLATPGAPLLTLEDATTFRLEVPLDEARTAFVTLGQPVDVRIDEPTAAAPDTWVRGRVAEIARLDPASHTFLVKVDLPAGACNRSGLFGRARFSGPARRALVVPRSAVVPRGQLAFVYLVDPDGRARLTAISTGADDGDRREVLAGVREKDAVVVNPPAWLTDGARVSGSGK